MTRVSRLAAVAMTAAICGCSSSNQFPASPVPAPLNDYQAASMASTYLHAHNVYGALLQSASRQGDGYLMAYTTAFNADGQPPIESRLLIVRNDGSVREIQFRAE